MGLTHKFSSALLKLLESKSLAHSKIVYCTRATSAADITNVIYLLGAFLVTRLQAMPEAAYAPFAGLQSHVLPYRDATWVPSTYGLHLIDCWRGIRRALLTGLYDPISFNEVRTAAASYARSITC